MSSEPQGAADEIAATLTRAWNAYDGDAFADAFTDDADFVNIFAAHGIGRPAIANAHRMLFETIYSGSTITFTAERSRAVGTDVVIAHIRADLTVPAGPMEGALQALATAVVTRNGDEWKIVAFQNTRQQTPPGFKLAE